MVEVIAGYLNTEYSVTYVHIALVLRTPATLPSQTSALPFQVFVDSISFPFQDFGRRSEHLPRALAFQLLVCRYCVLRREHSIY